MLRGLSLGRIFGVRIGLDWSVIVIFLLVTFQLGAAVFPQWHPDWSAVMNWGTAVAAAVVFFASILIHEMSHALVGRAHDVPVRSITLFIFGGMANIERRPQSPRAELLMAIIGPITSLVLGFVFIGLSIALSGDAYANTEDPLEAVANLGPAATLLAWVGPINVILAVFNMIPGFPLDGGRVLRAILWWSSGSLMRATKMAASVGQTIAWGFIIMGIAMAFGVYVPFFGRGLGAGLWLVLIGWFLNHAANVSYQQVLLERLLDDVTVRDLMMANAQSVSPDMTVQDLVDGYLLREDQRAYPVVDGERFVGLVCLQDIRKLDRSKWPQTPLREIMTSKNDDVETVSPSDAALDAVRKLGKREVAQIPVVEGERLSGLFRRQDFLRWLELQSADDLDDVGRAA